jgi:hypothetical protein
MSDDNIIYFPTESDMETHTYKVTPKGRLIAGLMINHKIPIDDAIIIWIDFVQCIKESAMEHSEEGIPALIFPEGEDEGVCITVLDEL